LVNRSRCHRWPEQQALVARLDALAEKTRQVEAHLDAVERDAEHLLALRFRDAIADAPLRPMAESGAAGTAGAVHRPEWQLSELGIRSFGKGTFHKPPLSGRLGRSHGNQAVVQRGRPGDLIFSATSWRGNRRLLIAQPEDAGPLSATHRMHDLCQARPELTAVPGFLAYYFRTEEGFAKVYAASPGTAARNRTLVATNLEAIRVPVPPLPVQQSFDRLQAEVAALRAQHAELRAANAALLPATLERVFAGGD
jgi:hypothetical protein